MAKNLLDAGHEILVHDVFPEAVVDLKTLGAATAATPSEVASQASTIVTMLPSRYLYCFLCLWGSFILQAVSKVASFHKFINHKNFAICLAGT